MTVRLFLLIAAAMISSGCNIQNTFLYFPGSSAPSVASLNAAHMKPWPPSATDYRGLVASSEVMRPIGTIVVFHGNGGTAADRAFYVRAVSPLGYRVILAEYPRYGGRRGELGEKAFVADANETVRLVFEQFGEPLYLLGESLGCGVAAAVAREASVKVDGIILITPWDTLASVAQSKFPFLPVRLLLTDTYDSIGNLKAFKGSIAVVGAEQDDIIPIKHANDLYSSLPNTKKRMWIIKEAGHNDWPMRTDTSWWKEITDFASGRDEG
jgi:uncharacterized protein